MTDCEVDGATRYFKPPVASPSRWLRMQAEGDDSDERKQREKRHENGRRRLDRKGNRRISTEPLYFFKNNESQFGNDVQMFT
ncbi:hypothetical protein TNCV_3122311 [Trichonephila clavipes]|nr:hypothetical protein TNCV_3122311 [Trichonephila clavipes]